MRAAPRQSASRAALGLSAIGAGAALLWTVNQQQNKSNTAQCEPTNASSNLLAFTAPPPTMLPVGCYDRTSTRLDGLTPEALATTSLEQLAERYNPDKPDKSSLLHEIVWGGQTRTHAQRACSAGKRECARESLIAVPAHSTGVSPLQLPLLPMVSPHSPFCSQLRIAIPSIVTWSCWCARFKIESAQI